MHGTALTTAAAAWSSMHPYAPFPSTYQHVSPSTTLAQASSSSTGLAIPGVNISETTSGYINYTTVTGYFLQDDPSTNATSFDYVSQTHLDVELTALTSTQTATNFGLINQTYPAIGSTGNLTQWQQFEAQVNSLNANAPLDTVYKVLFMGRHGEGYHNAAQTYYGTPGWNCYWAELNGNATATWADADLTPNGVAQAQVANAFWQHESTVQHIPFPQSYYTSPLTRCLRTANITFSNLALPEYYPFIPTVRELFRESISIHTCDRRGNRTYIHNLFPDWRIDPSLTEQDELWNGVTAETNEAQVARSKIVLDSVFSTDDHTWISITSHSGEIGSILRVLGHQSFSLNTGAVIPVIVKAEFLPSGPAPSSPPYTTSTHCAASPITSIATLAQGCVCTGNVNVTTPIYNMTSTAAPSTSATSTLPSTTHSSSLTSTGSHSTSHSSSSSSHSTSHSTSHSSTHKTTEQPTTYAAPSAYSA